MSTIVHIVECSGGVDVYLRLLLPRLRNFGYTQFLVCSYNYKREFYEDRIVDGMHQVEMRQSFNPFVICKSIRSIRSLLKRLSPDIVYCHSSFAGVLGRLAVVGIKTKVIYNPHGWSFDMRCSALKGYLYRWIERILALSTDTIVAISNAEKLSAAYNNIAPAEKIRVIINGVDLTTSGNANSLTREAVGVPVDAYVVGMVGRVSQQKAPDIFIRMSALVKRYIPKAYFVIVGDGDEVSEIRQLANSLGVNDSLLITGWVENVSDYVNLFDQAVLLSRWEGFGLVIAEYMRAYKPIVATAVGGIEDLIIHGMNGSLVGVDDYKSACDAVVELYNEPAKREKYVKCGYERLKVCFDVERVATQHKTLIEKLLK